MFSPSSPAALCSTAAADASYCTLSTPPTPVGLLSTRPVVKKVWYELAFAAESRI